MKLNANHKCESVQKYAKLEEPDSGDSIYLSEKLYTFYLLIL